MNVSDGRISDDEPLETFANILEATIDIFLYGSTDVKTENFLFCNIPFLVSSSAILYFPH